MATKPEYVKCLIDSEEDYIKKLVNNLEKKLDAVLEDQGWVIKNKKPIDNGHLFIIDLQHSLRPEVQGLIIDKYLQAGWCRVFFENNSIVFEMKSEK